VEKLVSKALCSSRIGQGLRVGPGISQGHETADGQDRLIALLAGGTFGELRTDPHRGTEAHLLGIDLQRPDFTPLDPAMFLVFSDRLCWMLRGEKRGLRTARPPPVPKAFCQSWLKRRQQSPSTRLVRFG
jgi:hypothetical protein